MQLHQNILDSVTKSAFNVSRPNHLPTDTYSPEPPIQRDGILAKMVIVIRNVGGVTLSTEEIKRHRNLPHQNWRSSTII